MNTVRKSISMDASLEAVASELAAGRGFKNSFSAYIQKLIEEDAARAKASVAETPLVYRIQPPATAQTALPSKPYSTAPTKIKRAK